ncbi:MAG: hypothetical protein NVSMB27_12950 [Ktedonobacteraceae bacterium]
MIGDSTGKVDQDKDLSSLMPDAWPELEDFDGDEGDGSQGDDTLMRSDPLIVRFVTEKRKTQRATANGRNATAVSQPTQANLPRRAAPAPGRVRTLFILLAIIAVIALIVDGALVSFGITHNRHTKAPTPPSSPVLTVTPGTVQAGQVVLLRISHFPASTYVSLSHDIGEPVRTEIGTSLVEVGPNGSAELHILIEDSWGPGSHIIEGEDVTTHYTASAIIQIIGAGHLQSPHLAVNQSLLNMGTGLQGANTIQSLLLHNTGGSSISWVASSDQPWLFTTPNQGTFSQSQGISVAVTRANLKPGNYGGAITIVSTTGTPALVRVRMIVQPLPANPGPVLVSTPPALSFIATDGGANPAGQFLTIHNPGLQPLTWSIASTTALVPGDQNIPFLSDASWIHTSPASSMVAPGSQAQILVDVQSEKLLPNVYSVLLTFTAVEASFNSPQPVVISLTVQPRCGIATSQGTLAFSASFGQKRPGSQVLGLGTSTACTGVINWQAFSSASWLSVTPANGLLQASSAGTTSVNVSAGTLLPGTYSGFILFLTAQRTQTVTVQLTVLPLSSSFLSPTSGGQPTLTVPPGPGTPTPPAGPPVLGASPSNLNFSSIQGQGNPASQAENIINSGGSPLHWQMTIDPSASTWLSIAPMNGTTGAGGNELATVSVNTGGLAAGTYSTQVSVTATDSSGGQVQGSPQLFTVTLTIYQPCSLQVSPANLTFTSTVLQPNPPGQNVTLKEVGYCTRPISWTANVNASSRNWLIVSSASGSNDSTIVVSVTTKGMVLGVYNGQVTLSAVDKGGSEVQNSPQVVPVTLNVVL